MIYKNIKTEPTHYVRAVKYRSLLKDSEGYAYLCQRQIWFEWMTLQDSGFIDDKDYKPFIMPEDVFNEEYEKVG
jgi:hypothetical protein